MPLTLREARTIVDAAMAHAEHLGQATAIVVLDASGRLLSVDQHEDARLHRDRMARGKATASLVLEAPTGSPEVRALRQDHPTRFHGLLGVLAGEIYLSGGGGMPIWRDGALVGAVGVAGGRDGTDDRIAEAGLAAWTSLSA